MAANGDVSNPWDQYTSPPAPNFAPGDPSQLGANINDPPQTPPAPAPPPPGNTNPPAPPSGSSPSNAIDLLYATFPWLKQLGIPIAVLQEWVVEGLTGNALYNAAVQTPQYQAMFPAIHRADGTLLMNEATYLAQEDAYRQLLGQYGIQAPTTSADLAGFFQAGIDPNELKQRLDVYQTIKTGSQDTKDAFYVYAGMRLSDDDLFSAAVDPQKAEAIITQYNTTVAKSPVDYQTWITRAAEAGLDRVVAALQGADMATAATNAQALQKIQQVDPQFAQQMADLLYHGGTLSGQNGFLPLNALLIAFQDAMIGSAATQSGLQLPDLERITALRQAGVTQAAALQAYSQYGSQQNLLAAEAQRAGRGTFDQTEFEKAVLLQQAPAMTTLQAALGQEKALTHATGGPDVTTDRTTGQTTQPGLRESFG